MALDSASTWGKAIADAVAAVSVPTDEPISATKLEEIWTAVATEHRRQLTQNMQASAPAGGSAHPVGGIVPISINGGEFS